MINKAPQIGKTYDDMLLSKKYLLISNTALAVSLAISIFINIASDDVIVMIPPNLTEEAIIVNGKANAEYQKRFSYAYALLLGNVNPANVDFVKQEMEKVLSPALQDLILEQIENESIIMKKRKITQRFDIDNMLYNDTQDIVWVWGDRTIKGVGTQSITEPHTYEFQIKPVNGKPRIVYFNSKKGNPKMSVVKTKGERLETNYFTKEQMGLTDGITATQINNTPVQRQKGNQDEN
jgi:conjugal transfer pilus assembly protein TraE